MKTRLRTAVGPTASCALFCLFGCLTTAAPAPAQRAGRTVVGPHARFSQILGRPTDKTVALSLHCAEERTAYVEIDDGKGGVRKLPQVDLTAGVPREIEIDGLKPDAAYRYRVFTRAKGKQEFTAEPESTLRTRRAPGATFVFGVQGDSHPERTGKMFHQDLYARTLANVVKDSPDLYFTLGDDFSIERLIERKTATQSSVDAVYALQRGFLGAVGRSTSLFLVNGNHEQAARYLLDGTPENPAVFAAKARTRFFPLPAPDGFYTGDEEEVPHIGLLRDYYAFTWGDALFVTLDPYWHSPTAVDNRAGETAKNGKKGGKGDRDLWDVTLGEAQYRWLARTLSQSKARWKFVFAHHVNGTGRGGVEVATGYEWGGRRGNREEFATRRPTWDFPVHALMAVHGVTIFFQGHDHLYARQELDGVVYQSTPNPADDTYTAFNREAYRTGEALPNSGHLRVTVSPAEVRVAYVRSFLPAHEDATRVHGAVAAEYRLTPRPKPQESK
jgi:hypothetical protein